MNGKTIFQICYLMIVLFLFVSFSACKKSLINCDDSIELRNITTEANVEARIRVEVWRLTESATNCLKALDALDHYLEVLEESIDCYPSGIDRDLIQQEIIVTREIRSQVFPC
ncbi:MAG TPA: hypothetical protein PKC30_07585 [Saprospiraceae bacterium]|nr:hypothetical protein [Saprospiraceae bacterium]